MDGQCQGRDMSSWSDTPAGRRVIRTDSSSALRDSNGQSPHDLLNALSNLPHGVLSAGIGIPWNGARVPAIQMRLAITLRAGLIPNLWFTHSAKRASRRAVREDL